MVLAIEMGVVFVLLTAILIALYIAWQNAKFVGDRLKKKQVMKRLVAGSAAIILAVVVAISTMVPAFAAETTGGTMTDGNSQIVYEEPDLGESDATDNCITLPDAPTKEGYSFRGWRVNGGSDLYNAGDVVAKNGSEELHLQPVYEAKTVTSKATCAPVTESKDTSNMQKDSSDVTVQNTTSKVDEKDDKSGLRNGIIGIVLYVLGMIPLFEVKWQASYGNDEIATALAKLALIAGMASVAFCVYAAICFS